MTERRADEHPIADSQKLRKYLQEEHQHKKKKPLDLDAEGWTNYWNDVGRFFGPPALSRGRWLTLPLIEQDVPQQENSCDCGIFTVSCSASARAQIQSAELR